MFLNNKLTLAIAALFSLCLFGMTGAAQKSNLTDEIEVSGSTTNTEKKKTDSGASGEKKDLSDLKYRLLQGAGLLVETAYQQEAGELEHSFKFSRSNRRNWATTVSEEIPLGGAKHQLSVEIPWQFFKDEHGYRGAGDAQIGYSYMLFGSNTSRVTVSPGVGLSLPTGDYRKELGRGAAGISFRLPVSAMIGKRFASNTTFETTYTRNAKHHHGERASVTDFEIGQNFVWYAKPKLNFLLETVWEREQEPGEHKYKHTEREFYVSPGVRWAHYFRKVLIVPSVGFPIGAGPSRGERGIVFSIAFEHSFKKEHD